MTPDDTILLVNRDKNFLTNLTGILSKSGCTIHTAAALPEALSILSQNPVGLIISGNDLEDISGVDFLRFLKSDPLHENIPLMFLVSVKAQGKPFIVFELGAVDYVVYPVDTAVLISRIEEAYRKRRNPCSPTAPGDRQKPLPDLKVDISRDGVLWMPGIVKSFGWKNMFLETAVFGKPGVKLMLRFSLAEGKFVINSHIEEITFEDFQKPAAITVVVEENEIWRRIHADLEKTAATVDCWQRKETADQKPAAQTAPGGKGEEISGTDLIEAAEKKKSYDYRFYQSIIGKQMDNYRAITLIGVGSMGGVLQGWDVALEREVALKIISYDLASKQEFRDLFIKEARVVSKLNHPNIAQIYSIGTSEDILYYAMEFIDGQTLKDILRKEGPLSIEKGLFYLTTICETLAFVYCNGVVHRDIKPANVMISSDGKIKLVDFGVAGQRESGSKSSKKGPVIGTPLYMSPEQIAGLTIDHRSDMYSLGATFYHAFSGCPPFESENLKEILDQHLSGTLVPLIERRPGTPPELCRVIEKMLAKDPNDRFRDFQAVIAELKTLPCH